MPLTQRNEMSKRIYFESIKKWAIKLGIPSGVVGSIVFLMFSFLIQSGSIDVISYSNDSVCAGTIENPCYAVMEFKMNEDVFVYPIGYDPWGRNTPFNFSPSVKSWKFQRSWGEGWRDIPLDKSCTGTWCGLSNSKDERVFSYAFRKGRTYKVRIVGYKYNPEDDIKWGSFNDQIDPVWYGIDDKEEKVLSDGTILITTKDEKELEIISKSNKKIATIKSSEKMKFISDKEWAYDNAGFEIYKSKKKSKQFGDYICVINSFNLIDKITGLGNYTKCIYYMSQYLYVEKELFGEEAIKYFLDNEVPININEEEINLIIKDIRNNNKNITGKYNIQQRNITKIDDYTYRIDWSNEKDWNPQALYAYDPAFTGLALDNMYIHIAFNESIGTTANDYAPDGTNNIFTTGPDPNIGWGIREDGYDYTVLGPLGGWNDGWHLTDNTNLYLGSNQNVSICVDFVMNHTGDNSYLFRNTNTWDVYIEPNDNHPRFFVGNIKTFSNTIINNNSLYEMCVIWDNSNNKALLYLNGSNVDNITGISNNPSTDYASTNIGHLDYTKYFNGMIRDFRLWQNYTLSESDVETSCLINGICKGAPPADTCTYTSGDWTIDCSDNCDIVSTDLGGNNIYASGIGTINNLKLNAYNYQKRIISGGCKAIN